MRASCHPLSRLRHLRGFRAYCYLSIKYVYLLEMYIPINYARHEFHSKSLKFKCRTTRKRLHNDTPTYIHIHTHTRIYIIEYIKGWGGVCELEKKVSPARTENLIANSVRCVSRRLSQWILKALKLKLCVCVRVRGGFCGGIMCRKYIYIYIC